MSSDGRIGDRFAYEVRSDWRFWGTIARYARIWAVLLPLAGLAAGLVVGAEVGIVFTVVMGPLPLLYVLPLWLLSLFDAKRVRVVLARDAGAWVIETETGLGTKVRRGALADLARAEAGGEGGPGRLDLIERGGRRHKVLEPGGRFAFPDTLTFARSEDGGQARRLPEGWGRAELLADMAARIEAFLRPSADPDAMRPLRR